MASFDKGTWQDLTREDMSRFGKIWQHSARFDRRAMVRFGKIWQDLARFDKGDMARFGKM